jgi:hypothetical protein
MNHYFYREWTAPEPYRAPETVFSDQRRKPPTVDFGSLLLVWLVFSFIRDLLAKDKKTSTEDFIPYHKPKINRIRV